MGDGRDNWWNQQAFRARGEYTIGSSTTAFFQYLRQQYGYGYDAYARDAVGNPVYVGAVTFIDGGIARRMTLSPLSIRSASRRIEDRQAEHSATATDAGEDGLTANA